MRSVQDVFYVRIPITLFFLFISQSTSANFSLGSFIGDLNTASSGGAAAVNDAKTSFTNPAGLSQLQGRQWVADSLYFIPSVTFSNEGSVDAIGAPVSGGNGGEGAVNKFIPSAYFSYPINKALTAGFTINAPFGLETKWDEDWVGRYHAIETGIHTINFSPALAYKVNEKWSLGASVNIQKTSASLSKALDFGAICFGLLGPVACGGIGLPAPQVADGKVEMEGSDWGIGYTLGALLSVKNTHVGFSYRSRVDHVLDGEADFTAPAQAAAFAPAFTDSDGKVDLTLPAVLSMSVRHKWVQDLIVMADYTITQWSSFKELKIDFDNPAQPKEVTEKNWKDTKRISLGLDYKVNSQMSVQGGFAVENSAIPDSTFDPSIPVTSARWVNVGVRRMFSNNIRVDFAYAHGMFEERDVKITGSMGDTLIGKLKPSAKVLSLKLSAEY